MLTSQQIVSLACQIAKCPGMQQQAGQFLNARLVQIALDQDLDIVRRTTTIPAVGGQASYNLPATYLRAREVFYNISGVVFKLDPMALEDYDAMYNAPGFQNYPYNYSTDIAQTPPLLYLYPTPSISFTLTVRYMDNSVEITTPENSSVVPWFQDQRLLVKMLAEDLMDITDDERASDFWRKNDEQFRRMLTMSNDMEGRVLRVKRDPLTFRSAGAVRPTKIQGD